MNVKHKVQSPGDADLPKATLEALIELETRIDKKAEELGLLMDQYVSEAKALYNSDDACYGKEGNATKLPNRVLTLDLQIAGRIFETRTLSHRSKLCACLNQLYGVILWGDVL